MKVTCPSAAASFQQYVLAGWTSLFLLTPSQISRPSAYWAVMKPSLLISCCHAESKCLPHTRLPAHWTSTEGWPMFELLGIWKRQTTLSQMCLFLCFLTRCSFVTTSLHPCLSSTAAGFGQETHLGHTCVHFLNGQTWPILGLVSYVLCSHRWRLPLRDRARNVPFQLCKWCSFM